ncbi:MAG: hypothetical protein IJ341_02895 [Bacteroidales bacterium]|nr:hypothetical protein [Bacteroidales bacterium]
MTEFIINDLKNHSLVFPVSTKIKGKYELLLVADYKLKDGRLGYKRASDYSYWEDLINELNELITYMKECPSFGLLSSEEEMDRICENCPDFLIEKTTTDYAFYTKGSKYSYCLRCDNTNKVLHIFVYNYFDNVLSDNNDRKVNFV